MSENFKEDSKTPVWAWLFVIACIAIPIITLGGAIPGAIGFGGAAGCYKVSRNPDRSRSTNVMYCVGITAIAWGAFFALILIFS